MSFAILLLSIGIDISHVRAFPSYNIALGLWTWYVVHFSGRNQNAVKKVVPVLSGLCWAMFASVISDVIFCSVWGSEIVNGVIFSLKFSLSLFIINMLGKIPCLYFSTQNIYYMKCLNDLRK